MRLILPSLTAITDSNRALMHALPCRYSELLALAYALFSLIYWAAGGTGYLGAPYIYSVLDWESAPGIAAAYVFGVIAVAGPLLYIIVWAASYAAKRGEVPARTAAASPLPARDDHITHVLISAV